METGAREKPVLRLHEGRRAQKQQDKTRARRGDLVKAKFTTNSNKESSQKEKKIIQKYSLQSYPNMPFTSLYII